MGYDMYFERRSEQMEEAEARAQAHVDQCRELRDQAFPDVQDRNRYSEMMASPEQAALDDAYDQLYAAQGYFRLNIWGMGRCRQLMFRLGMLDAEVMADPLPNPKDFGLAAPPEAHDKDGERIDWASSSPERAYLDAHALVFERDYGGRIPAFKLSDNSGWLVAPSEIHRSLEAFRRIGAPREVCAELAGNAYLLGNTTESIFATLFGLSSAGGLVSDDEDTQPVEWWGDWVDWISTAADYGGFRVY